MHKFGFTLSEVLITLGIIGVVAAMTIPSLLANTQKEEYTTKLKKAYTTFTQGMQQYIASQGVMNIADTELYDGSTVFSDATRQTTVDNTLRKIFKILKACKYGDSNCQNTYAELGTTTTSPFFDSNAYSFINSDGMLFQVSLAVVSQCNPNNSYSGPLKSGCGTVYVDVNGTKKPNQLGRDLFMFELGSDGNLFPFYGHAYSTLLWETSGHHGSIDDFYWQNGTSYCGALNSTDLTNVSGNGCAARIMDEGWKMNY